MKKKPKPKINVTVSCEVCGKPMTRALKIGYLCSSKKCYNEAKKLDKALDQLCKKLDSDDFYPE